VNKKDKDLLTPKQKRFCDEYLKDLNGTQAAIRAGYSKKTANRIAAENLSKLVISEYIKNAKKRVEEKISIDVEYVLKNLKEVVVLSKRKKMYSATNKALELLGNYLRMFDGKVIDNPETLPEFDNMNEKELDEFIKKGLTK
jgi:phage terminase small subunit